MAVLLGLRNSGYKFGLSVNAGPLIAIYNYLRKLQYAELLDSIIPPPGKNSNRLSHGKTAEVLLLFFYCSHHAVYRCDGWVEQNPILKIEAEFCMPEDGNLSVNILSLLDDSLHIFSNNELNSLLQKEILHNPSILESYLH